MRTADFAYRLPPSMIARSPLPERDAAHLLRLERASGRLADRVVRELPQILRPGDLLVLNTTKVFPARLLGVREATGGKVEALLIRREAAEDAAVGAADGGGEVWLALTQSGGRLRLGERLVLADGALTATLLERRGEAGDLLRLAGERPLAKVLAAHGQVPVPPYLGRAEGRSLPLDRERYQTVYAREVGAVAAPTAGLHFSRRLLEALAARGVERAELVLHVGPGTFRPVKSEAVEAHVMLPEPYRIPEATAAALRRAKAAGRRVVAVGTTVVRALEGAARAAPDGLPPAGAGETKLFVYPPFEFRVVDALLTNFHLPRSTLLMLVAAFAAPNEVARGRERILAAYRHAVAAGYRFYSYGDAMLLE